MPYISTDDETEIYYRDWGTGAPVVLIHGWPSTSDMWDVQANFLAENGYRVITYDRRGFGRSDQPWSGYDYDTFAGDLNALMEDLDLQDATLIGFSMGGGEVIRYLTLFGDSRVSKAVLISSVTPYLIKNQANPDGVDAEVFDKIGQQIREDRPAFFEDFNNKFFGRTMLNHTVSEPVLQWARNLCLTGSTRSTLAAAVAWSTTDFRAEMARISTPILLIHGTGDVTVPIDASSRRAIEILPNATLIEYEDEPHGLFLTATERLHNDLTNFLAGVPIDGAPAYVESVSSDPAYETQLNEIPASEPALARQESPATEYPEPQQHTTGVGFFQ